jgi:DNA-binding CsgD family transcriptional regulator
MAVESPDELIRSVEGLPVPAMLTELVTHTFVAVNEAAASVFGSPAAELVGTDGLAHHDPRDSEAARAANRAMTEGVVDRYRVLRRIVTPDGDEVALTVWGRRVECSGRLYGLWVFIPTRGPGFGIEMLTGPSSVVLALTNHNWQIQYVNADAKLFGAKGAELRGFPFIGLVHPSMASEFAAAFSRTAADGLASTWHTRMPAGADGWADRDCFVVPVCEHQPPRLGVVHSEGPSSAGGGASPADGLTGQVGNYATEARAARALAVLPALGRLPEGGELSARQSEILARLVAGECVAEIARSMFLSASTVRNHLWVTYKKFGVHSQAELLATLLRSVVPKDQ